MSPIALPLMSSLVSEELLPRAFRTMVRSLLSLESARDSEVRGWEEKDWGRRKCICAVEERQKRHGKKVWKEKEIYYYSVYEIWGKNTILLWLTVLSGVSQAVLLQWDRLQFLLPPADYLIWAELMSCLPVVWVYSALAPPVSIWKGLFGPCSKSLPTLTKAIVIYAITNINIPFGILLPCQSVLEFIRCLWIFDFLVSSFLFSLVLTLFALFAHPVVFGTSPEKAYSCPWQAELTATLTPLEKSLQLLKIPVNYNIIKL